MDRKTAAAASTPGEKTNAVDSRERKRNDGRPTAKSKDDRGMFVPITLGVPDSVPAGENLMLMITPQNLFSTGQSQTYYIAAMVLNDVDVDDLLGTGGAPFQETWDGAQGPQPIFYDLTIAATGVPSPVVFSLFVSDNAQFQGALETPEIVVY